MAAQGLAPQPAAAQGFALQSAAPQPAAVQGLASQPAALQSPAAHPEAPQSAAAPQPAAAQLLVASSAIAEQGAALQVACAQALVASVIPPITARRLVNFAFFMGVPLFGYRCGKMSPIRRTPSADHRPAGGNSPQKGRLLLRGESLCSSQAHGANECASLRLRRWLQKFQIRRRPDLIQRLRRPNANFAWRCSRHVWRIAHFRRRTVFCFTCSAEIAVGARIG